MSAEEYNIIGQAVPRIDALDKITGTAQYLPDLEIPGMLYGKILRSPYAHARILKVDTSRAEKLPGVRAVVTGKDTQGIRIGIFPQFANKPPLAEDRVRYIGDEIAGVAAEREEIAEEALDLIDVEYEELPALFDPAEAMKPGAVKIHEEGNVTAHRTWVYGDVEKAFAESDYIFEDHFETQAQSYCALETHGAIAHYDGAGNLTIWLTTHWVHHFRTMLAGLLKFPFNKLRVISAYIGGSFGRSGGIDPVEIVATFLSKKTRRPVRILYTHDEQFSYGRIRYPIAITLKTGVKKDGTLLARQAKVVTDNGAYNSFGTGVTMGIGTKCTYLWSLPNVAFEADVVFTNKLYGAGFRGFGNPQITFAIESQMDRIARELGMDMKELCLKNVNYPGQVTCMGHKVTSCGLKECIEQAAEASGWKEKRGRGGNRGVGMASLMHTGGGIRNLYGECNLGDAFIKMNNDGTVDLASGAVDLGQGSDTILAQIAAEELGIPMEDIRFVTRDTAATPQDHGAWGSRQVYISGNAVRLAALDLKKKLLEDAAQILEVKPEDLLLKDRQVCLRKDPAHPAISIAKMADYCFNKGRILVGRGIYDDPSKFNLDQKTGYGGAPTYAFGTQVVEVEVDPETAKVKVLGVVAAHDVGKIINPLLAEGQIEGGILQGLGYALSEGLVVEDGLVLNANLQDYRIPYINDAAPVKVLLVESRDPDGPYGAKGLGEPVMVPTAAAVANAIHDAVGVRITSLPITPEKILKALQEKRSGR